MPSREEEARKRPLGEKLSEVTAPMWPWERRGGESEAGFEATARTEARRRRHASSALANAADTCDDTEQTG